MVLDVSVFGPYKQALRKYKRQYDDSKPFSEQVVPIIAQAVVQVIRPDVVQKGFIESGVMEVGQPLDTIPRIHTQTLVTKLEALIKIRTSLQGDDAIPPAQQLTVTQEERLAT